MSPRALSDRAEMAFVLAAGLGTRMRPLTDRVPKPLVKLAGRCLLDHVLDRLAAVGIDHAVVNVHYLADQIERHVASRTRTRPRIGISDERSELLDTGGGLVRARPLLGPGPVVVHNSDSVWIEGRTSNLRRLIDGFDAERMDGLLLLADRTTSLGYDGRGDFHCGVDGRLSRVAKGASAPFVFAGASIATERLMQNAPDGPFSLNRVWDRALRDGRLYGVILDGVWMHVGDPAALSAAEDRLRAQGDGGSAT